MRRKKIEPKTIQEPKPVKWYRKYVGTQPDSRNPKKRELFYAFTHEDNRTNRSTDLIAAIEATYIGLKVKDTGYEITSVLSPKSPIYPDIKVGRIQ